jgi:hypothetical protein
MLVIILENLRKENWNMQNNMEKQSDSLNPTPASEGMLLTDSEITGIIAENTNTPFPPLYFDENMVAIHKVVEAQLLKCRQSEAARIKELESELEIIDKNYRIKKGETWYWEKDSNNYLESLTCPVIINANDLRDLISEARADQNRKIGDYILNIIGKKPHLTPSWLVDLAAKLQKGESPEAHS